MPSPDGKLVAVSLSENGSEDGTLHLFDVATGKEIGRAIPRVQYPTGGGSVAWRADSKGFWYTRYPGPDRPAEEQHFFQQVYFHRMGDDPAKDAYVLGKDLPKVAEIVLENRFDPLARHGLGRERRRRRIRALLIDAGRHGPADHALRGPDRRRDGRAPDGACT